MDGQFEPQGEEDQLVMELLDDHSPFLLMPKAPQSQGESIINKLISAVYSGPTLGDIENALPTSYRRSDAAIDRLICSRSLMSLEEKGVNKMENKYTLRIKGSTNGLADDGYKWRKYGQKSIKNSPHPRSYYRCTNPRCNAKKQVERSKEDPDVFIVTYEGLHLHYAYSHFFIPRPLPSYAEPERAPETKKPKMQLLDEQILRPTNPALGSVSKAPIGALGSSRQQDGVLEASGLGDYLEDIVPSPLDQFDLDVVPNPQGLLEDIVPQLVRNPNGDIASILEELYFYSQPSSPLSSSSSCLSMSPLYF